MAKLQVGLLAAIVLGTMSRCEVVAGPSPDSVAVSSPNWKKLTMNVSFNGIKLKGPDSDVVYHRTTVTDWHLQFATNETVNISSTDFLTCAKAAASQDLDAFLFNGTCTGYRLDQHFLKCQTGDLVLYVRSDSLNDEAVMVPIEEASYKLIDVGLSRPYELRMLHAFLYNESSKGVFAFLDPLGKAIKNYVSYLNVIVRGNEELLLVENYLLDVFSCVNDGAYGLPIFVTTIFDDFNWPILYLSEHCGETITVQRTDDYYTMLVFSHPGHGCIYYPSDAPDECAVTLEGVGDYFLKTYFYSARTEDDCTGFDVIISIIRTQGKTVERNACPYIKFGGGDYRTATKISLKRNSPTVWPGFSASIKRR